MRIIKWILSSIDWWNVCVIVFWKCVKKKKKIYVKIKIVWFSHKLEYISTAQISISTFNLTWIFLFWMWWLILDFNSITLLGYKKNIWLLVDNFLSIFLELWHENRIVKYCWLKVKSFVGKSWDLRENIHFIDI